MSSLHLKEFMCSTSDRYCLLDVTAIEYGLLAVKTIQKRTVPGSHAKASEYLLIGETHTDRRSQVEVERRATAIEYSTEKPEPEIDGGQVKPRSGKDQPGLIVVGQNRLKARQDEPDATAIEYALESKPDTLRLGQVTVL
jgi:hypothetical protein